jgi:hypothetical protein
MKITRILNRISKNLFYNFSLLYSERFWYIFEAFIFSSKKVRDYSVCFLKL